MDSRRWLGGASCATVTAVSDFGSRYFCFRNVHLQSKLPESESTAMRLPQIYCLFTALACFTGTVAAAQDINCALVTSPPLVDGRDADPAWAEAQSVRSRDAVADLDHDIRCVHTEKEIFFLVSFPDRTENRQHKTLVWNPSEKRYAIGPKREDTLVLKWNMEPLFTDITLGADTSYRADIWYWKSVRTDHAGFADDKMHIYSDQPSKKAKRLLSKTDKRFYLSRPGDKGRSAYASRMPTNFDGDTVNGYDQRLPEGSRSDVRAKGHWSQGTWTVEFARALVTGHPDDLQLSRGRRFQLGISRFEIAGRTPNPDIQQPNFGSGEIGEDLTLILDGD